MSYDYTPEPNRKTGLAISFSFFLPSMILLAVRTDVPFYRSVLFAASIFLFTVGACIFFRFVMTRFTYRVESNYGGEDLVIFCVTGKKSRTVLRVSFDSFISVCETKDKRTRKKNEKKKTRKYFYCSDIFGKDRYFLYLYDSGERCRIKFCPDATIRRLISDACRRNGHENLT